MIHHGDALAVLRTLPDETVHCCVTSPPYYGLRDYGTARWDGGLPDCDHMMLRGSQGSTGERSDRTHTQRVPYKDTCGRCGATRVDQQIGLERTPEEFVARLVEVFREVRRVLRADGTCWVNLGDSYATGAGKVGECPGGGEQGERWRGAGPKDQDPRRSAPRGPMTSPNRMPLPGLKPKDLIGIPWMVAFALRADDWWLRSDVVWAKGNGMPESVKDRPTRAHEYIFLLSKSERYFYDYEAVKEPVAESTPARYNRARSDDHKYANGGPGGQTIARTFGHMKQDGHGRRHAGFNEREFSGDPRETRNLRSWWLFNTEPNPEAHFACMPLRLAERCILAGCPPGGTVLDPFAGAGTTGLACLKHGREFVGIELNAGYIEIAERRARKHYPLLVDALA